MPSGPFMGKVIGVLFMLLGAGGIVVILLEAADADQQRPSALERSASRTPPEDPRAIEEIRRITDRLARQQCEEVSSQLEARVKRAAETLTEKGYRVSALDAARGLEPESCTAGRSGSECVVMTSTESGAIHFCALGASGGPVLGVRWRS